MPENLLDTLPEIFVSTTKISAAVSKAVRNGKLRKIGPRLYTKNLTEDPEQLVSRNLWQLVGSYVPGALIADRTAIENVPAKDGSIFVITSRKRDIELPGITIKPRKGHPPLETDRPFVGDLFLSSMPRAFLENMAPSRARSSEVTRTLNQREMEARLEDVLRRGGEIALNTLRDNARRIAEKIGREKEFTALDRLIGALLGTREAKLETSQGKARRAGTPFDPDRLQLFEDLHAGLRAWPDVPRPAPPRTEESNATLAFFEAYFSNFIEGTEFDVAEAADIVFRGVIPRERPEDAHDVLGTWRIVSDDNEMRRTPDNPDAFIEILRARHTSIMGGRPDTRPGQFKQAANRAGATVFVTPELVEGTLLRGFEFCTSLDTPFARAVFMMFLVSEVHPFADGNGRVARVMMNAELIAQEQERIVIPTAYRDNYLSALKAISLSRIIDPIIRMLDYAQNWTASMPWTSLERTQATLDNCNAFMEQSQADEVGVRLKMPEAVG